MEKPITAKMQWVVEYTKGNQKGRQKLDYEDTGDTDSPTFFKDVSDFIKAEYLKNGVVVERLMCDMTTFEICK